MKDFDGIFLRSINKKMLALTLNIQNIGLHISLSIHSEFKKKLCPQFELNIKVYFGHFSTLKKGRKESIMEAEW